MVLAMHRVKLAAVDQSIIKYSKLSGCRYQCSMLL